MHRVGAPILPPCLLHNQGILLFFKVWMSQISYSIRKRHTYLPSSVMRPSALWFCTEVSSLSTDMRIIYRLFRVSLIGDLLVGSDVVVMVCMSILAVLSTPLGMIECVKSASQVVLRASIIFCLIVQPTLTSGTVMPPFPWHSNSFFCHQQQQSLSARSLPQAMLST